MKRFNVTYLLLVLTCWITLSVHAQPEDFFYTKIAGTDWMMPSAYTIYNEEGMYLWIGTNKGIYRFDGIDIKHYTSEKAEENILSTCLTFNLIKDERDNLWALTSQGIGRYNRNIDQFELIPCVDCKEEILGEVNTSCLIDRGILFGCKNKMLIYDYAEEKLKLMAEIPGYESDFIYGLQPLSADEVVFYQNDQVHVFNFKKHSFRTLPPKEKISCLFVDSDRHIWMGVYNRGLMCMDANGVLLADYMRPGTELSQETVICMVQRDSLLWAGTDGGGIKILNPRTHEVESIKHVVGESKSFPSNSISCMHKDPYNTIWVGSVRDGIIAIRKEEMRFYSEVDNNEVYGLSNSAVLTLLQDKKSEDVWIGTDGEGINRLDMDSHQFVHYASTKQMKVVSIAHYNDNELLISIYLKGLFLFNIRTGTVRPFIPKGDVAELNTEQNVSVLNFVNESDHSMLILSDRIYRLCLDTDRVETIGCQYIHKGNRLLWAGNLGENMYFHDNRGIYCLRKGTKLFTEVALLDASFFINAACLGENGKIWMATNNGVFYHSLSDGNLHEVQTGLLKNASIIFPDNQHRVWIGNGDKLYAYQEETNRFAIFGQSDGAQPNQYINKARLQTPGGDVLLGGTCGLLVIDNTFQLEKQEELSVVLTGLKVDDKPVSLGKRGMTMQLDVSSSCKVIGMRVATVEKDILRPKLYRFKITGANEQFLETYSTKFSMNALRPGKSAVHVSCSMRSGEWTPYVTLLTIDYPPVWYKSLWFFLICLTVLLMLPVIVAGVAYRRKKNMFKLQLKEKEKEIYRQKVSFLININHELRTPLTLISGPLKLMIQQMVPSSTHYNALLKVYRQSMRMKSLLDMVLDLRKMEVGEKPLKIAACNVNDWVNHIVSDFNTEGSTSGVYVEAEQAPEVGMVNMDVEKCEIVLTNLLVNAIKHSNPEDKIVVQTSLTDDDMFQVSVVDQGVGLKEVNIHKLFSRFYQSADEKYGTGIGLSYSKVLVELHRGEIGAYNNADRGATFFFKIPLSLESGEQKCTSRPYLNDLFMAEQQDMQDAKEVSSAVCFDLSRCSILLVDDSTELTDFLKESLDKTFKNVYVASNGLQAWKIIEKDLPDIVISDVMMPKMNGYELCKRIKGDIKYSHLPVILLTAKNEESTEQVGYKMGADAFLSKPFDLDTLLEIVKNNLKLRDSIKQKYIQLSVLPEPKTDTFSRVDEDFLFDLNKIIGDNIANVDLDIPFLCKEIGMSKTSLYTKLKALTGMGCNEYISKIRLERAMMLIKTTNKSFTEIAFETGFATSKYFSTSFKQYAGMTPTQYKKQECAKIASE